MYKISCNDCDATYVGQTGRKLKTRIAEHRNHIKYNTSARSVITEHRRQLDHEFKWEEVEILDEEPSYRRRLVSEMINIRKQKNGINLQTDTEGLHKAYIPIRNRVWLSITDSPSPLSVCVDPHYWTYMIIDTLCLFYISAFLLSVHVSKVFWFFLDRLIQTSYTWFLVSFLWNNFYGFCLNFGILYYFIYTYLSVTFFVFNLSVLLTRTSTMTILIFLTVQPYGNYVSRSRLTRTVIIRIMRILATIEFILLFFIVLMSEEGSNW